MRVVSACCYGGLLLRVVMLRGFLDHNHVYTYNDDYLVTDGLSDDYDYQDLYISCTLY